jgi:3-phosphoshikimate 1-carboxyvinyltransferase
MTDLRIEPLSAPFDVTLTPPGSKSLTNRALVLAAMAAGDCTVSNVLLADDTVVMLDCLRRLGFDLHVDEPTHSVRVAGRGGQIPAAGADLFCGNSGTTIRFLTALCALGRGTFTLDGVPRMRQRPIAELSALLHNLGVRIEYGGGEPGFPVGQPGFPPVRVLADKLPGGWVRFGRSQSSQFLSAVLQVAPYAKHEVRVQLEPNQTSWPYVAMTMRLMDQFGVTPHVVRDERTSQPTHVVVENVHGYQPTDYQVEPDASGASYFLAAAAIHPGSKMTIEGLGKASLQGDVGFADVLHKMGADLVFGRDFITILGTKKLVGIDVDLSAMPDTAQTLAVAALFAEGPTRLRGLHTLRVKETDRVAATAAELEKLGADVSVEGDDLLIDPPETGRLRVAAIDTYDDHRMAMAFALAGTKSAGVTIKDAGCVSKTYPAYFEDLEKLRAR